MLHPIVGRFPHARRWAAMDRYELMRRCHIIENWMRLCGSRVFNRTAATWPPLNACQTFDGAPSNNERSSVPLYSVKRK
jgi:hypothetical protein